MDASEWYSELNKPLWAPPDWVFAPVWTFLYTLIFISFGWVFWMYLKGEVPFSVVLPFFLNLLFNFAFTPLQFGLQNNILASFDLFLVLVTLVWAMFVVWPYARWVFYFQIPYFVWVLFATVLQFSIAYLNF
ncbi:MAG: TspO/MBR family protein [Candidatus Magasanikbacteria bacterium]